MIKILLIAHIAVAVLFAVLYFRERYQTEKMCDSLDVMLSDAAEGTFAERDFDESRLSRIETEFADYLNTSEISARAARQEKDRIKSLIADISHQTKTPIANLVLYSELLEESSLSKDQMENAEAIHTQAEKLRFLIDALVKLSRLENEIIQLVPKEGNMGPVLQAVCRQFRPKAEGKGLALQYEPTELSAAFDPKWTQEAIGNIVDNAIKYTENGKVCISCRAYELFARIDIRDTGIGIPEEELPRIFQRFYRSGKSSEKEGVGLGLYLAREIISAEDGYIKVSSVPGKGTVFSVFLPRPEKEK
ncbi:MAG: HAMP domain-containing sensor histidine kinase [Eubacterium sp.]|nr:HAMP domain-containing sensor histidine kinase [Eubacterium sp.]